MRPRDCTDDDRTNAYQIGRLLAEAGATVINGGGIGVMEAASAGAKEAGGLDGDPVPDAPPAAGTPEEAVRFALEHHG